MAPAQTVVALGDSLTQGYGLPDGEGFVPVLQGWLRDRGHDATIINAGVSGDTTAGGLSRADWALQDGAQAVIVNLGGNDMLRGLDPAQTRANLDAILTKADERGLPVLLIGLHAPGNYGPEFQTAFNAIATDLAAEHGAILADDYLGPLVSGNQLDRRLMQSDGIHPNADGVRRLVDAIGPQVEALLARVN